MLNIPGQIVNGRWEFPPIESVGERGSMLRWQVFVRAELKNGHIIGDGNTVMTINELIKNKPNDDYNGVIEVESRIGDGKTRDVVPTYVISGKNIGKVNATNPVVQAIKEANGMYTKRLRKTQVSDLLPPMLASVVGDDIVFPVWMQRKYNGVRAMVTIVGDSQVVMYSRGLRLYPGFEEIKKEVASIGLPKGVYLDGELYKHGVELQQLSGLARRQDITDSIHDLFVYDLYDSNLPNMPFEERFAKLSQLIVGCNRLVIAPTVMVNNRSEMDAEYKKYLSEGYEGAMLRSCGSLYKVSRNGIRSSDLMKMKPTLDHEFEVVGWKTGDRGKAADAFMIICKTTGGIEFPVTPALPTAERNALTDKMINNPSEFDKMFLGKKMIVYFDEWSEDKLPLRARTKLEIREEGY